MNPDDFDYELPETLIAQQPPAERGASRLLALGEDAGMVDLRFADLIGLLRAGDLLVVNDSRVLPARLFGRRRSGGRIEMLLERTLDEHLVKAQLRASHAPAAGTWIDFEGDAPAEVIGRDGRFFLLRFSRPVRQVLEAAGQVPLPPYIRRRADLHDRERYQTLFARVCGSVAAPTAGLHFDAQMLDALRARGVGIGMVTLHVGAGTFAPLREAQIRSGRLHAERVQVGAATVAAARAARRAGGRIVAVGTTAVRALETAAAGGDLVPYDGETDLFIQPGHRFRTVDAMVTNFHLPRSSLLMLVCAFGGRERVLAAYRHAVAHEYRFFSYGDAMFLVGSGGDSRN